MADTAEWTPAQVRASLDDLYTNGGVPPGGDLSFAFQVAIRLFDSETDGVIQAIIDEVLSER